MAGCLPCSRLPIATAKLGAGSHRTAVVRTSFLGASTPDHHKSSASGPSAVGVPCTTRHARNTGKPFGRSDLALRAATEGPFPFYEEDYYQVKLQVVAAHAATPGGPVTAGNLVLIRSEEHERPTHDTKVLMLAISGDALLGISRQLNQGVSPRERPLAMDLLWSILQRGQEVSKQNWELLRVAVVDLQEYVFLGRLFFGDAATGEQVWDCDCRPSDACWLALRSKSKIYVAKRVWDDHSVRLRDLEPGAAKHSREEQSQTLEQLSGTAALTTLRGDDPEPLKLLKRKLAVAIGEEDYHQAASIRDHPYMALHLEALRLRLAGRPQEAAKTQQQLFTMIEAEAAAKDTRQHQ